MKKILYLFLTGILLCLLVGCNENDAKDTPPPGDIYWVEWENMSDYPISYFEFGNKEFGINCGKYVSDRLTGSSIDDLAAYIDGQKTSVVFKEFVVDGETYAYMEVYSPEGSGDLSVPKNLQDLRRYTLRMKEKNGRESFVWTYTFTNADYEAAKARGPVHITIGDY